ncbi:MAG: hypothetical protein EP335_12285 [Alphaproteobacteria bacterium]|nr:MAG: hypothetical protein EP335_12285 [Alphaproteobacteria bacterium]
MNSYFLTAGLFSALTAFIHMRFGGREIAGPLLAARDLHPVAKYTNYFCWHMVSIVIVMMAGCYLYAALKPGAVELAGLATLLAFAFAFWNLALIVWKQQRFDYMPQWALFLAIGFAGVIGFFI